MRQFAFRLQPYLSSVYIQKRRALTSEQKQAALQRHREIILATVDYLLSGQAGSIVFDGEDVVAAYYEQQKLQIEKYYKQRRPDRLQQRLVGLTKGLQNRADLRFAGYVKEKTGYGIDIFEDLRNRVDAIVAQKEIRNQKELNDVGALLHFYRQTLSGQEKVDVLNKLVADYSKLMDKPAVSSASPKSKGAYSEVIKKVEKDGIEEVTTRFSTGPGPKHLKEREAVSPDGKRKLRVTQWSDGTCASTYVTIEFPTASGAVYGTNGIRVDINAAWKNNATIVIETKKAYIANTQHKEVRSFDDVITIEYMENE